MRLRDSAGGSGLLLTGVVFLAMAAGGALPVLGAAIGWLRRLGAPAPADPAFADIVRAAANPGSPAPARTASAPSVAGGPTRIVVASSEEQ